MGVPANNITDEADVIAPTAAGFLPGMEGLHIAVVKKLDGDISKECRIQVELPWMAKRNCFGLAFRQYMPPISRESSFFPK